MCVRLLTRPEKVCRAKLAVCHYFRRYFVSVSGSDISPPENRPYNQLVIECINIEVWVQDTHFVLTKYRSALLRVLT